MLSQIHDPHKTNFGTFVASLEFAWLPNHFPLWVRLMGRIFASAVEGSDYFLLGQEGRGIAFLEFHSIQPVN